MSAENKAEDMRGRAKEAAGAVTGDEELKNEGRGDQASAHLKDKVEDVKDAVTGAVDKARDAMRKD